MKVYLGKGSVTATDELIGRHTTGSYCNQEIEWGWTYCKFFVRNFPSLDLIDELANIETNCCGTYHPTHKGM